MQQFSREALRAAQLRENRTCLMAVTWLAWPVICTAVAMCAARQSLEAGGGRDSCRVAGVLHLTAGTISSTPAYRQWAETLPGYQLLMSNPGLTPSDLAYQASAKTVARLNLVSPVFFPLPYVFRDPPTTEQPVPSRCTAERGHDERQQAVPQTPPLAVPRRSSNTVPEAVQYPAVQSGRQRTVTDAVPLPRPSDPPAPPPGRGRSVPLCRACSTVSGTIPKGDDAACVQSGGPPHDSGPVASATDRNVGTGGERGSLSNSVPCENEAHGLFLESRGRGLPCLEACRCTSAREPAQDAAGGKLVSALPFITLSGGTAEDPLKVTVDRGLCREALDPGETLPVPVSAPWRCQDARFERGNVSM